MALTLPAYCTQRAMALSLVWSLSLAALIPACGDENDGGDSPDTAGSAGSGGTVGASGAAGSSGSASPGVSGAGASGGASGSAGATAPRAGTGGGAGGQGAAGAGAGGEADAGADDAGPGPGSEGGELGQPPIGWATESGDGVDTTTGGLGGETVTPADEQALIDYAESEAPLIIQIDGTFAIPELRVASNKTLIGVDANATIEGGVRVRGSGTDDMVSNVIIQNLRIHGATSDVDGDGMHIYYAHHVWVDHCEIWDSPDGNLDIVHASSWVTISWTKFWYSQDAPDLEHRFSNLVGHSEPNEEDVDRLKVTFHHNWWAEGVIERMPRVRYGDVHVFNNYYSAAGNNYAIGAGFESRLRIENNHFDGVADPHIFYDDEPTAEIAETGNAYTNATGLMHSGQGDSFEPPYAYALDRAADVPALVMAAAGPR